MPRADRGSIALDISSVAKLGSEELAKLLDIAVRHRAIIVTAPSTVPVWGPTGPIRVVLGVGSIVYPPEAREELAAFQVRLLELGAPEWIEGCVALAESVLGIESISGNGELEGKLVPGDLRDPLALMLAGADARALRPLERNPPVASIGGEAVVWYSGKRIMTTISEDTEAWPRLRLASRLLGMCD